MRMNSLCLYSSYFSGSSIPSYIRFYLNNLTEYFGKIVFVTNEKSLDSDSLSYLRSKNIELMIVQNEGWDFGMWYKAMKIHDPRNYDRLALVNDSCVLFRKPVEFMNWSEENGLDYFGMVDSNAVSYHIQSFFIVATKKAIPEVFDYFQKHGILSKVQEVIRTYEIGLSCHMAEKDYRIGAMYSTKSYKGEFSPMFLMAKDLISKGLPLIKKKVLFCSYREDEYNTLARMNMDIDPQGYVQFIRETQSGKDILDLSFADKEKALSAGQRIWFSAMRLIYRIIHKIKGRK